MNVALFTDKKASQMLAHVSWTPDWGWSAPAILMTRPQAPISSTQGQ